MVEVCRRPGDCRVTGLARGAENFRLLRMVRVRCAVVIVLMASNACRGLEVVVVVRVAVGALGGRHRMAAAQDEAGCGVIEFGIRPIVGRVATLARRARESWNCIVLRIAGAVEVFAVAADAVRGHIGELGEGAALMAILTSRSGVRTGQREPVHVHVDLTY